MYSACSVCSTCVCKCVVGVCSVYSASVIVWYEYRQYVLFVVCELCVVRVCVVWVHHGHSICVVQV